MQRLIGWIMAISGLFLLMMAGLLWQLRQQPGTAYLIWAQNVGRMQVILLPDGEVYRQIGIPSLQAWARDGKGFYYMQGNVLLYKPLNGRTSEVIMDRIVGQQFRHLNDGWLMALRRDEGMVHLYRVREDGQALQKMTAGIKGTISANNGLWSPYVAGWLYFQSCETGETARCYLYKVKTDGSDLTLLNEDTTDLENYFSCDMFPERQWLLFCDIRPNGQFNLYALSLQDYRLVLSHAFDTSLGAWWLWQGEKLLYIDRGWLMRQNPDGSELEALFEIGRVQPLYNRFTDWLYYHEMSETDTLTLARIALETGEQEPLLVVENVIGEPIYTWLDQETMLFAVRTHPERHLWLYYVPLDGSPVELITTLDDNGYSRGYLTLTPDRQSLLLSMQGDRDYLIDRATWAMEPMPYLDGAENARFSSLIEVPYQPERPLLVGSGLLLVGWLVGRRWLNQ